MTCSAHSFRGARFAALGALALGLAGPAQAISVGAVQTFEDGSTGGWFTGAASSLPVKNVDSGGPQGAGDAYLLAQSAGGSGAGSRLVVMNDGDWTGDLAGAGVTGLRLDVRNFGDSDIVLRVRLEGATGAALSSAGVTLPSASGWTTVELSLEAADLVASGGDVGSILSDVALVRLFHGPTASFPGPASVASLGIDNVTAVPEPDGRWLSAAGLCVLAGFLGTRRRTAATRAVR